MSDQKPNPYKIAQDQLQAAAKICGLPGPVISILSQPKNEIIVNFPVRMDNGDYKLFKGYRVQHNNILGPYKGGIRYHEQVSLDEVKALASLDDLQVRAARHPVRRRQGRHQVQPARPLRRASWSASPAASPTPSAPTSAPSTTSPRPTSAPTARSWSG